MPNIYIIDDLSDKCAFGKRLSTELVVNDPHGNWVIRNDQAATQENVRDLVRAVMNDSDALLLIDVQLLGIRCPCSLAALQQGDARIESDFNSLWQALGQLPDYILAAALLAYCKWRGVPVFVISTRPNAVGDPLSVLCTQNGYDVLANWPDTLMVDNLEGRARVIATRIVEKWNRMRGDNPLLRLWPQKILDEQWFANGDVGTVPHGFNATANDRISLYLHQLLHLQQAHPKYDESFHEMLKSLVGMVAKAHIATGVYMPHLATIALLGALWDPEPNEYLPAMQWKLATQPRRILLEGASHQDAVCIINEIAGPKGVFKECLRTRNREVESEVVDITCATNAVVIKLRWLVTDESARKHAQDALNGEIEPRKGSSKKALWRARQSLLQRGSKLDIEITNDGNLKFFCK